MSGRPPAIAAALAFLLAAATPSAGATDLTAVFPPAGFVPGWERVGPPVRFDGADLYNHIDGAAEVFLELGFDNVLVQDYGHGKEALTVELYAMSDEIAAAGVYLMKSGSGERSAAVPGRHAFTSRQIVAYRGNVLVIVTNDTGERAVDAMIAAGATVIGALPPEAPLPLGDVLPSEGRRDGTLRFIRGPFTLQRVFTLGDGDVLQLAGQTTAVAADYDDGRGGSFTRIAATYADDAAAAAALAHLRGHLDPYLEVVRDDAGILVFRDGAGRFGEALLAGRRLELRVHITAEPPLGPRGGS